MKAIIILVSICILLVGLGIVFSFLFFKKLKRNLENADFGTFKKELGNNYKYKVFSSGLTRCRWSKGWISIKADFDEKGKLINEKISYKVWGPNLDF